MFDHVPELLTQLPTLARFAFAMTLILTVPTLCRRLHLPAVVGLLVAGVAFGPYGLQVGPRHNEVAEYFSEIGKLLLMFFAGLEIDIQQFQRTRNRSLIFGVATFAIPLLTGFGIGFYFGYGWVGALVIGSLLASHTLLAYPIVQRLGLVQNEAVTVTIGATILTDIASLLVLAVCVPIHLSGFSPTAFIVQLVQLAVYIPLILFGLSAVVRYLMERMKGSKEGQFLVMLLSVAVAGIGAELIHLEGIIGAFLAGLALNRAVQRSPAKDELEFLGNTLFIPVFFITIGYLINPRVFAATAVSHAGLVFSIVFGLLAAKLLAALAAQKLFHYRRDEALVMWSLSMPQVAATLAAALVAYNAQNSAGLRLIDEPVLNSVIVLMVVTSLLGPILTDLFGRRLVSITPVLTTPSSDRMDGPPDRGHSRAA
jgi:Kef-type K+ transport system membrane component KefB